MVETRARGGGATEEGVRGEGGGDDGETRRAVHGRDARVVANASGGGVARCGGDGDRRRCRVFRRDAGDAGDRRERAAAARRGASVPYDGGASLVQ